MSIKTNHILLEVKKRKRIFSKLKRLIYLNRSKFEIRIRYEKYKKQLFNSKSAYKRK